MHLSKDLETIKKHNPGLAKMLEQGLKTAQNGGFDEERAKTFLSKVEQVSKTKIPFIEKLKEKAKDL